MISYNKPYFNTQLAAYKGIQPFFYENKKMDWCNDMTTNYNVIKQEFLNAYNNKEKQKLITDKITVDAHKGWNQTELMIYGMDIIKNFHLFPQTVSLIKNIPHISTCYFSILQPNTQIKPHVGDTDAFYRFHFGLVIPAGLPLCGIQVGSEKKEWKENDFLCFNDVHKHTAWNHTNDIRVVLIIDVLREFENYPQKKAEAKVLATLAFSRINKYLFLLFELTPRILIRAFQYGLYLIFKIKLRYF